MSFHEVRFPASISLGSSGGPERKTEIVTLQNGYEERNAVWAHSRRRYDAGMGMASLDDLSDVTAFFEARHGRLFSFRWKDWADFKSCSASKSIGVSDQILGSGDGAQKEFSLRKSYNSGGETYWRPISKPVLGSVVVGFDGVTLAENTDYNIDYNKGVVTFAQPPLVNTNVTAGFEFDVPVRFELDTIETNVSSFSAGQIPNIPVVEVRV